jgi:hypothetical protein
MKSIRFLNILTTSAITALLTLSAHAMVTEEIQNVPDTGSSALLLCGAITAIIFARRRLTK